MMDTTRRHPRTLAEAFPRGAEYGCAIERPAPSLAERAADVLLAVTLGIVCAALAVHWWAA